MNWFIFLYIIVDINILKGLSVESSTLITRIDELQFGDIILETDDRELSWLGWIIQKILSQPYCHGVLYLGHGIIIEAVMSGVRYKKLTELEGSKFTVLRCKTPLNSDQQKLIYQVIEHIRDAKYDFSGAFYLVLLSLRRRLGFYKGWERDYPNPIDSKQSYFCFQLLAKIYNNFYLFPIHYTNANGLDFIQSLKLHVVFSDYSQEELYQQLLMKNF